MASIAVTEKAEKGNGYLSFWVGKSRGVKKRRDEIRVVPLKRIG